MVKIGEAKRCKLSKTRKLNENRGGIFKMLPKYGELKIFVAIEEGKVNMHH